MNEKILIVDDEPDILHILSSLLTREGYQISTAGRGEEAVELFRSSPTDIVITDMRMPGMDGQELIRHIKGMDEETEVIVLTGFATIRNGVTLLRDYGAFDYLTKPLESIDDLLITITKALERRRLRRDNRELLEKLRQSNEELENKVNELDILHTIYEAIVEGVPVGLVLLDSSCRILFTNDRFNAILGLTPGELTGKPVKDALSDDLKQKLDLEEILNQSLRGEVALGSECPIHTGKGEKNTFVDIKAIPLKEEEESIHYILIILEDVSQRIQMEQKIRRMDRLSALGELSAGIAHEIRNPLTAISSNAQLLYESTQNDKNLKDLVEIILIGVKRMEKFMKDVLDFARPRQAMFSKCMLDGIVCHALRLLAPQAIQKNVQLEVNWTTTVPPLKLDAAQIQQVLINFLLNALLATPSGGKIMVELSCPNGSRRQENHDDPFVLLSIADTGKGIAPEHVNKIFDPFFTTRPSGTGLGLTISHSILREHDVDIQVESRLGEGTTFFLRFPIK